MLTSLKGLEKAVSLFILPSWRWHGHHSCTHTCTHLCLSGRILAWPSCRGWSRWPHTLMLLSTYKRRHGKGSRHLRSPDQALDEILNVRTCLSQLALMSSTQRTYWEAAYSGNNCFVLWLLCCTCCGTLKMGVCLHVHAHAHCLPLTTPPSASRHRRGALTPTRSPDCTELLSRWAPLSSELAPYAAVCQRGPGNACRVPAERVPWLLFFSFPIFPWETLCNLSFAGRQRAPAPRGI